ncbi:lmo0937 family membrane protein [Arenibacter sp. M-2]|uniref:lmo0937 family membrane protein n=1 Tax=Arenibacter sp. M-2 TaxID=3053612 RepID=UPI00336510AB
MIKKKMSKILIIAAILLLFLWAIGFFIVNVGILIHLLLLLAVVLFIARVIRDK